MVVKEDVNGTPFFQCEICGFHYQDKKRAEKCEEACREGHCRSEITEHSLERSG